MGEGCAWVTLATNDSYCLGALVLAHSLKRVATTHQLVILVTPQVTPIMKERLSQVFSEVVCVDVLDSGDAAHLALLERPELGITFTKLHCWSLTQYSKCVFLDADTLVLQNCDELFEREELSAAPDVGWPDCFNSGVFVYRPSIETFNALIKFAKEKGSFDGGDQGLLNQFFSTWATGDIKKHLPFLYNVCSTSFYSYLPALKQYGKDMKIVHFIGSLKPWLQNFNWGSRSVQESGHLQAPLQHWWDIFIDHVHPVLDVAMPPYEGTVMYCGPECDCEVSGQRQCGAASPAPPAPQYPALYTPPPPHQPSPFPWHRSPPPVLHEEPQASLHEFVDPWDHFTPAPTPAPPSAPAQIHHHHQNVCHAEITEAQVERQTHHTEGEEERQVSQSHITEEYIQQINTPKPWYDCYVPEEDDHNSGRDDWNDTVSHDNTSICSPGGSHCGTSEIVQYGTSETYSQDQEFNTESWQECQHSDKNDNEDACTESELDSTTEDRSIIEEVRPRHVYDNFYLLHRTVMDRGHKRCSHERPLDPSPPPTPPPLTPEEDQAGVAGALSQLAIGDTQGSPALDEHLRRQGWEAGNIDYMGADAFDNIWAKISETLTSPSTEPSAPEQPAPIPADSTPVQVEAPTVPAQVEEAPKVPTSISEPILPPAEVVPLKQVPSEALSAASTDSWEQVSKGTTLAELAASEVSVVAPASSEEVSSSSIESSTASTASSVSSAPSQAEQEPKATTEEKRDSKLVKAESGDTPAPAPAVSAPPSKPKEKLVCHLKPAFEVDLLLTPESEHEDAATIAQSIIASEEALLSPIITSATPPGSSPIIAAIPQNIRDLSVDTAIPETPPVPGLVSLAQIGIISSKSSQEQPQTTTPEDIVIKETETVVAEPKKIKIVKKKSVDGASSVKKTAPEPKTPEDTVPNAKKALPETKSQVEIKSKAPKTPDAELEEHKLVCSIVTKEDPAKVIAQIVLPDDLEKIKPVKKTTKTPAKKTESSEVSPKAAEVDITSAPEESISLQIKLKSAPAKKVAGDAPKVDLPVIEDIVAKGDVSEKKEEPSTPTEEVVPKPKVKKMVKKVPATPKVKSEGVPDSEASKGADAPVPPPRKKVVVVKPKEKI